MRTLRLCRRRNGRPDLAPSEAKQSSRSSSAGLPKPNVVFGDQPRDRQPGPFHRPRKAQAELPPERSASIRSPAGDGRKVCPNQFSPAGPVLAVYERAHR